MIPVLCAAGNVLAATEYIRRLIQAYEEAKGINLAGAETLIGLHVRFVSLSPEK
jgi:hypothetical protein